MEGGRDDYLFWMNDQNIFFQLRKLTKYCLRAELDPAQQKAQNGSFVGLHSVSNFMPQRLQDVITNKKGMPVTEILNTCTW